MFIHQYNKASTNPGDILGVGACPMSIFCSAILNVWKINQVYMQERSFRLCLGGAAAPPTPNSIK